LLSAHKEFLLTVDKWPSRESFETFFREQEAEIRPVFERAGVTTAVEPTIWRELDTHDAYGWGV